MVQNQRISCKKFPATHSTYENKNEMKYVCTVTRLLGPIKIQPGSNDTTKADFYLTHYTSYDA